MQCPQISDEKTNKFCSIDEYFLIRFLKDQKLFVKEEKNFFFNQKSEGIAFTFCR